MYVFRIFPFLCFLLFFGFQTKAEPVKCQHGQIYGTNRQKCHCEPGYIGRACNHKICGDNGYYNGTNCICKNNFVGGYCKKLFGGCEKNADCKNGGVCVEKKCECKGNYLNADCSFECNCKNNGVCSMQKDEKSHVMAMTICDCKGTYYREADCSKSLCFNDFENDEAGNCVCQDGFFGDNCETKTEDCDSSIHCSNGSLKCVKNTTHLLIDDKWTLHENLTKYECSCPKDVNCEEDETNVTTFNYVTTTTQANDKTTTTQANDETTITQTNVETTVTQANDETTTSQANDENTVVQDNYVTDVIQFNNDKNFTLTANCTYQNISYNCLCNEEKVCMLLSSNGTLSICKNCNETKVECFESDVLIELDLPIFICNQTLTDKTQQDITPLQASSKLLVITSIVCGVLLLSAVAYIVFRYYRERHDSFDINPPTQRKTSPLEGVNFSMQDIRGVDNQGFE